MLNSFVNSNIAKLSTFLGSLTTLGVFRFITQTPWLILICIALGIGAILVLIGKFPKLEKEKPLVHHHLTCRYCRGKGKLPSTNGGEIICRCCDGFGNVLHPIKESLLGNCNLCESTLGRDYVEKGNTFKPCKLCHGYAIEPELIGEIEKRVAATPKHQSPQKEERLGLLSKIASFF